MSSTKDHHYLHYNHVTKKILFLACHCVLQLSSSKKCISFVSRFTSFLIPNIIVKKKIIQKFPKKGCLHCIVCLLLKSSTVHSTVSVHSSSSSFSKLSFSYNLSPTTTLLTSLPKNASTYSSIISKKKSIILVQLSILNFILF